MPGQGAEQRVDKRVHAYNCPMTTVVFLAVLVAALSHATWNAFIKSGTDKSLDVALVSGGGALVCVPIALFLGPPPAAAWPYIAASAALHFFYYLTLAQAYRFGDLTLAYPIMRGCAPLLLALAGVVWFGETLNQLTWLGIALVAGGVIGLGLSSSGHVVSLRATLLFALANAALIACYTAADGRGVRLAGGTVYSSLQYVATLFAIKAWPYVAWTSWRRGKKVSIHYLKERWKIGLMGGAASIFSYGIALWAMTRAPVAQVAALRETSVLFAALIGVLWLKEKVTPLRVSGALIVVAGVMALRLG
jgi:drug/metabolite transporter (DMT)-like permease